MERVKISYAVDLNDVPSTANDLMLDANHWVADVAEELGTLDFNSGNLASIQDKVHEIRRTLARIDQRIDDCYAITVGYHQTLVPAPDGAGVHTPEPDIEDKLRELQQAMEVSEQYTGGSNDKE